MVERAIRFIAGTFVVVSVVLAHFVSPYWLLFTAFVGLNLAQSAFTGFCPMETLIRALVSRQARRAAAS
jgi:hypothetical protein